MHEFDRCIKLQDQVGTTRFGLVLSLSATRRAKGLNWKVGGCLGWYHYESWTGVVQGVPAYRRHGRKFPKSNPACGTGATTRTVEKTAKMVKGVR